MNERKIEIDILQLEQMLGVLSDFLELLESVPSRRYLQLTDLLAQEVAVQLREKVLTKKKNMESKMELEGKLKLRMAEIGLLNSLLDLQKSSCKKQGVQFHYQEAKDLLAAIDPLPHSTIKLLS